MNEFFARSAYAGMLLSLSAYGAGVWLKNKTGRSWVNPLLTAIVLTIGFLVAFRVDYASYNAGGRYLSYLLTPATVCLALPLYEQVEKLKNNAPAILTGILAGVITSLCTVLVLALLFRLDRADYVTLLPKSVTTAIGMGISEKLGGHVSVSSAVIILTGVQGNILAPAVCRLCRITHPVARGIAIGTSSHAIGTTRAMEMGQVEGAMSSLSIVVAGVMTVVGAGLFAGFIR